VNSGKNCRLDRDAVSGGGLAGPKHARIILGPDPHMGRGNFGGNGAAQCNVLVECGFGDAASSQIIIWDFLLLLNMLRLK